MSIEVRAKITSRSALDKYGIAKLSIRHLSMGERVMSGLKWLGICWLAGIGFVFIPILHFILVPLALLVGIFIFFQRLSLNELLVSGELKCPACEKEWSASAGSFGWPKREICPNCGTDIRVGAPEENLK